MNKTMLDNVDSFEKASTRQISLVERCDRCSAAALVRAVKNDSELLFCGHHGRSALSALVEQGWKIDDQTHRAFMNRLVDDDTPSSEDTNAMRPAR